MSRGSVTAYLLAQGWQRSDATPDELGYCDAITERGSCERAPRWSRRFDGALCAQHAVQASQHRDEFGRHR